jgi:hypothetical protein
MQSNDVRPNNVCNAPKRAAQVFDVIEINRRKRASVRPITSADMQNSYRMMTTYKGRYGRMGQVGLQQDEAGKEYVCEYRRWGMSREVKNEVLDICCNRESKSNESGGK